MILQVYTQCSYFKFNPKLSGIFTSTRYINQQLQGGVPAHLRNVLYGSYISALNYPKTYSCYAAMYKRSADVQKKYTVDGERFAGLNIRGFSAIEVFAEIFSRCLGHKQCISTHYLVELKRGTYIHRKTSAVLLKTVKTAKFSPANLSPFTV